MRKPTSYVCFPWAMLYGLCLLSCASNGAQATLVAKYLGNNPGVDEAYYVELIETALRITEPKYGPYRLEFSQTPLSSERKHELLVTGERLNIDRIVGFHKPTGPRSALLFINVPLLRNFMGYRIPLIRSETQKRFDQVKSLDDLRKIPMGLGKGWEGYIYQHNGFNVAEPVNFESLLKMLAGGRYDFVPLSAIEIDESYQVNNQHIAQLAPEKRLLIYTPLPNYFYVSPQAPELAVRLRVGLKQMQADGSMDRIFDKHFGERLRRLQLAKRQLIVIPNPEDDGSLSLDALRDLQRY
jgi:hypothetical protein